MKHARTLGPDWKRIQMRQTQNGVVLHPEDVMTRQRQRRFVRMGAFHELSEKFSGEPRANRRLMAIRAMHNGYRKHAEQLREKRKAA